MTIRPKFDRGVMWVKLGAVVLVSVMFVIMVADGLMGILFGAAFAVICLSYLAAWFIIVRRTLHFDREGCTIRLFHWEWRYTWDQFAIKRIEPSGLGRGNPLAPDGGVFFSVKRVRKPIWQDPRGVCMRHPRSCFWVSFAPSEPHAGERIYEVDREEFLGQLREWGVTLTK